LAGGDEGNASSTFIESGPVGLYDWKELVGAYFHSRIGKVLVENAQKVF
jgi:hypothetical protein